MSSSQVLSRLKRGFGAHSVAQAAALAVRFFEVPLFLAFWGATQYGEWLLAVSLPTYLVVLASGYADAARNQVTIEAARGDRRRAVELLSSMLVLLWILAVLVIAAAVSLAMLLPLREWLKFEAMDHETLCFVILLAALNVAFAPVAGLVACRYLAEALYPRGTLMGTLPSLTDFAAIAIALLVGAGPVGVAGASLGGRLVGYAVWTWDSRRIAPWLVAELGRARVEVVASLVKPALGSTLMPIGQLLNVHGLRFVIGAALGPSAVAAFAALKSFSAIALKITAIAAHTVQAELSMAYGAGDTALLKRLFNRTSQLTFWSGVLACGGLHLAGLPLFQVWTQEVLPVSFATLSLLSIAALVNAMWYVGLFVAYATNRHAGVSLIYVAGQVLGLTVAVVLAPLYGQVGVASAVVLSELVIGAFVIKQALTLSGQEASSWMRVVLEPPFDFLRRLVDDRRP